MSSQSNKDAPEDPDEDPSSSNSTDTSTSTDCSGCITATTSTTSTTTSSNDVTPTIARAESDNGPSAGPSRSSDPVANPDSNVKVSRPGENDNCNDTGNIYRKGKARSESKPTVCDCLVKDCTEKTHSTRRHFIEHYYNSRTQLPSASASASALNISTPLNKLSECDAITKRLLSSPTRTQPRERPVTQKLSRSLYDHERSSRRASLGTKTMTDEMLGLASDPFKSLELDYLKVHDNEPETVGEKSDNANQLRSNRFYAKHKEHQQPQHQFLHHPGPQQVRSLSVCDEEPSMNLKPRGSASNHSFNLSRAISLASEANQCPSARKLLSIIPLFGCDIKSLEQFSRFGTIMPPIIDSAMNHILNHGINSLGIFRKSGVKSRILTLRQRIEADQIAKFEELNQNNEFSIYDIADLVKMWFRELKPSQLMTKELINFVNKSLNSASSSTGLTQTTPSTKVNPKLIRGYSSQDTSSTTERVGPVPDLTNLIDPDGLRDCIKSVTSVTHRALLLKALGFFEKISSKCDVNQMTSQNLSICLTPSLCATEPDQNSILIAQRALEFCINNNESLFHVQVK